MSDFALELILISTFGDDYESMIAAGDENPFAFLASNSTRDLGVVLKARNLRNLLLETIAKRRARAGGASFDFLSMYMDATDKKGVAFTDSELLDELITLIVAGFETSANTLNWVWYLLAGHPQVEERLLNECSNLMPNVSAVNPETLAEMTYAQQVLEEVLRLYPPVWLFTRRSQADDELDEFDVPSGTDIYLSPYILHRTARHWPDPDRFDPDRFDLERLATERMAKNDRPYFPFSLGPRRLSRRVLFVPRNEGPPRPSAAQISYDARQPGGAWHRTRHQSAIGIRHTAQTRRKDRMKLYSTLIDLLDEARGKDREIRFIDGKSDETTLRFGDLWDRATALLGSLQARGMQPGDELVIFSKSNQSFVVAYWAAMLGGIVPVPVAVGISDEHRIKLFRILRQLERGTLFTELGLLERLLEFSKSREMDEVSAILESRTVLMSDVTPGDSGTVYDASADDIAFIQYSSGSTSDPKGVCLTHANLCANVRAIIEATQWGEQDRSLSWMPLTHDMGLIGYHLSVMAAGMDHAVMDTNVFVRRPLLWMLKTSELQATQLCSPNFGYKHFLKLFERKGLPDGTDLSCVRLILNGAEPISYDLCEEFLTALAPYGLKRSTMFPVYGLAEATVGVTVGSPGDEFSRVTMHRHSLSIGEPYVVADAGDADAVSFVKVGNAIRDCEIRLADDNDNIVERRAHRAYPAQGRQRDRKDLRRRGSHGRAVYDRRLVTHR